MHRWILFAASWALFGVSSSFAAAADAPRPNILFIMVDEMRWDVMSCAGHPIVKTPNLDRLAHEGTRFATAYTCGAVCSPSRYSFFTSRYVHVHGAVTNGVPTREPQLLLPTLLTHDGYQTAISGKLHFTPAANDYDFDDFWSFNREGPGKLQNWPDYLKQKLGSQPPLVAGSQPYPHDPLGGDIAQLSYPKEDYQTFWITDRAVDFLHQRDAQKPFFLFVSYLDPHSPSHLPEPYWSMAAAMKVPAPKIPPEVKQERAEARGSRGDRGAARHLVADEAMAQALTANYYATMSMVDDNVGRLLDQLRSLHLADNTIVVFTADHGNMLGDRGRWFKGLAYEGSAHIPLLMKAAAAGDPRAAAFNAGKVIPQVVENIDVMPTLCDLAGLALPAQGIQGRSLVGLVSGSDPHWKNVAFSGLAYQMIRTPQYKLIRNSPKEQQPGQAPYELYDLTRDPQEEHNLAKDPASAKIVEELSARLDAWQQDVPPVPVIEGLKIPDQGVSASDDGTGQSPPPAAKRRATKRKPNRARGENGSAG